MYLSQLIIYHEIFGINEEPLDTIVEYIRTEAAILSVFRSSLPFPNHDIFFFKSFIYPGIDSSETTDFQLQPTWTLVSIICCNMTKARGPGVIYRLTYFLTWALLPPPNNPNTRRIWRLMKDLVGEQKYKSFKANIRNTLVYFGLRPWRPPCMMSVTCGIPMTWLGAIFLSTDRADR